MLASNSHEAIHGHTAIESGACSALDVVGQRAEPL
jgi:hypothetical protein